MTATTNTTTVRNVALLDTGRWDLPTGPVTIREAHLHAAVAALDSPGVRRPVVVLAVADDRVAAHPVVGRIENLRVRDGVLRGDIAGLPEQWAQAFTADLGNRAVEGHLDHTDPAGHHHDLVVTAVRVPAVLRDHADTLPTVAEAVGTYGTAAPDPATTPLPARARHALTGTPGQRGPTLTAAHLDKIANLLGLDPATAAADLLAVLDTRLSTRTATPTPEVHVHDAGDLAQLTDTGDHAPQAEQAAQAGQAGQTASRDALVLDAVRRGKIPPAHRQQWSSMLAADPAAGEVLASMPSGLIPVDGEIGHDHPSPASNDLPWQH